MSRIEIRILRLDFQPPECLIEEVVHDKMRILDSGLVEPVTVRFDGESYFLQDGFHRVEAARRCGMTEIDAEISSGSLADMEAEFREMLNAVKADLRADGESPSANNDQK